MKEGQMEIGNKQEQLDELINRVADNSKIHYLRKLVLYSQGTMSREEALRNGFNLEAALDAIDKIKEEK